MDEREAAVIAFHGIDTSPRARKDFYGTAVAWFGELGYRPDQVSVWGDGYSGKPRTFDRMDSRLRKTGFGGVEYWQAAVMEPDGRYFTGDNLLAASFSARDADAYIAARLPIAALARDSMLVVAVRAIRDLHPVYGIGYTRPERLGPQLYPSGVEMGLTFSPDDELEGEHIATWGIYGKRPEVLRAGILRGVYPWNFLTTAHLNRPVNGVPLEQWIRGSGDRGTLTDMEEGVNLWEVEMKKIPTVYRALWKAGLILDRARFDGTIIGPRY